MKKKFIAATSLALAFGMIVGCSCGTSDDGSSGKSDSSEKPAEDVILDINPVVPDGYLRLDVNDTEGYVTEGYGCQVDTHIFKTAYNNFYTDEDLKEWLARIDDMKLQSIRTQIFPEWYERGNDNDDVNVFDANSPNVDFNSIEMQQLYKLLDICEERDIKVDLSFYGCCKIFESQDGKIRGSWLANSYEKNWITAPKLKDEKGNPFDGYGEYAESVAAALDYLINVKKYTCLYVFSVFPEPNLSFLNDEGKSIDADYIRFCKVIKAKLLREKLWDKITFAGPGDCANDLDKYKNYIDNLKGVLLANTSSVYMFNDESTNDEMYRYARNNVLACKEVGATWGVCESGSNRFIDAANQEDTDTYNRAVFLARTVINYANAGCTNVKYWVLNDVNYGGYIMKLGLWKEIGDKYNAEARPQFYSWSLITKYAEFGSVIYPVVSSDPDVCMVAYKLAGGGWSYLIANSGRTTKKICITSLHSTAQGKMNLYVLSGSSMPDNNRTITSSETKTMENGALNLTLRSNSFTVLSFK